MSRFEITQRITDSGAVAIIRLADASQMIRVVEAISAGGISAIEITMTVPNALRLIEETARHMRDDVLVGVGSVTDAETAKRAVDAGAQYVVSPIFKPEIIKAAHEEDVAVIPGTFSPTEIQAAHEAGADLIKVFPADGLGMAFFKAVLAPLPHLRLIPTGGVSLTNAGDWLAAGAVAVGVGSALLDKKAISEGRFEQLTQNARTLMASIDAHRNG